ncbi:MAG TPA: hypothetical protein VFB03_01760 [Candidatus Saccharimonadales bacterium]|nr:hypothetical protein [Candidatus Saccharimonadales bacterium]
MARTQEVGPVTRERQRITAHERSVLVGGAIEHTAGLMVDHLMASPAWASLESHSRLVGLMGILQGNNPRRQEEGYNGSALSTRELAHLRRIVGFEANSIPIKERGLPGKAEEFWQEVHAEAGREITRVASLPDNFEGMSRAYRYAFNDWISFQEGVVMAVNSRVARQEESSASLLFEALKASYEQVRARKHNK